MSASAFAAFKSSKEGDFRTGRPPGPFFGVPSTRRPYGASGSTGSGSGFAASISDAKSAATWLSGASVTTVSIIGDMGRGPLIKADTRADPIIEDALAKNYLESDEAYSLAMPSHELANTARRLIGNAARRRNLSAPAWVTDQDGQQCLDGWKGAPPCADPEAPHYMQFKLWSKDKGRTHVFRATGGDPANLKYNPWQRNRTRRYDDSGNPA